jgi:hypothetical protein
LIVSARLLFEQVGDLVEPARMKPVEPALLPADDRKDRALAPADERNERREVELRADLDLVRHGLA